eukprot:CAMPEP_0204593258 /NCGR_PEP_ID=MMETSP0661-20131031/51405_1 /ASSEMBLY_ACC=CAM_ASM_000606 /TAXON_ID=109239 /ORGANISM="Alexandrium margalefi, Strain AMGDE01CS-322" /LENGTH=287 /DNA_ID=CAMNT_0051603553 /DNA_START=81 /DNA_END=944 /DNA_ORIENTATION=+
MGGSSKVAAGMMVAADDCGYSCPKVSALPAWNSVISTRNVSVTDELDDTALMDLAMARAAVLAAMRMCENDLPATGERLAAAMKNQEEEEDDHDEPMVVATHLQQTDKAAAHMQQKDKASDYQPCYVHPALTSQLCWRDIDSLREQRRELLLRGLPARLCNAGSLKKLLGALGLDGAVVGLRVGCAPGRRVGHAVLRVKSAADVKRVARFFHGWQCGASMPIAVSFHAGSGKGPLSARPKPAAKPAAKPTAKPAPALMKRTSSSPALIDGEELTEAVFPAWCRRSTD